MWRVAVLSKLLHSLITVVKDPFETPGCPLLFLQVDLKDVRMEAKAIQTAKDAKRAAKNAAAEEKEEKKQA